MRAIVAELPYASSPPEDNLTLLTALSLPQSRTGEVCAGAAYGAPNSPCGTVHLASPSPSRRLGAFLYVLERLVLMAFDRQPPR